MKITALWKPLALLVAGGAFFAASALADNGTGNSYNPVIGTGSNAQWNEATVSGVMISDVNALNGKAGNGSYDVSIDPDTGVAQISISGFISYNPGGANGGLPTSGFTWGWNIAKLGLSGAIPDPNNISVGGITLSFPMDQLSKEHNLTLTIDGAYGGADPHSQNCITKDFTAGSSSGCSGGGSSLDSIHVSFEIGVGCFGSNESSFSLDWLQGPSVDVVKRSTLALTGLSHLVGCVIDGTSGPRPISVRPPNPQQGGNQQDNNGLDILPFNQRLGQKVRQVLSKSVLIDLQDIPGGTGYALSYYTAAQAGSLSSGLYSITGSPFKTITVENPGGDINTVRITRAYAGSTQPVVEEFFWDEAAKDWSLREGYGSGGSFVWLRTSRLIVLEDDGKTRVERREVSLDGTNGMASVTETTYSLTNPSGKVPIQEVVDPDGAALTSTWTYHTSGTGAYANKFAGRLQSITKYNGYWKTYEYDDQMRPTKIVSQYNGSEFGIEADSEVTIYTFGQGGVDEGESTSIAGVTTGWRSLNRSTGNNQKTALIASSSGENIRERVQTGQFINRITREVQPGGIVNLYSYTATSGGGETTDHTRGKLAGDNVTVIGGVRTITTRNKEGEVISQERRDVASGLTLDSWSVTATDGLGRATQISYSDGTTVQKSYDCCNLASETDRQGITTTYEYDSLKRITSKTRLGVSEITEYDAADRVIARKRKGTDNVVVTVEQTVYDKAGRVMQITDALGQVTTMSYAYGVTGTTVTTTYPDGGTHIETTSGDGRLKEIAGTAVAHLRYEYGVASNGRTWSKEIKVGDAGETTEWITTYSDVKGNPVMVEHADGKTASMTYNAAGQLVSQTDPDGITTLYTYDAKGEQETVCIDVNQNGVIDFGGTDRITQTIRSVLTAQGTTVQRTVTQVYAEDGSATPTVTSTVDTSVDGLKTWQTQFGQTTTSETVYSGSGSWTVTVTNPDGTQREQAYSGGQLTGETFLDNTAATVTETTYAYTDVFGRLSSTTDSRTGTTSYTYDAKDRVLTTTAPAINGVGSLLVTATAYNDINNTVTVTLPDGSTTTSENYPNGQLKKAYGSQTYPIEYTYDAQGRMKTMVTHSAVGNATTTWNYDAQRGWLTSKVYADGKATGYTYTSAGRLHTRTWARTVGGTPLATTYVYNTAGDLTSTSYSDSTPAVAITYNRPGAKLTTGNSVSATAYGYDSSLRLVSETATGVIERTLERSYDACGRASGITVLNDDVEHQVSYEYDTAGRLAAITTGTNTPSAANTFSYGYVPNSASLIASITGPVLTGTVPVVSVANIWESTRDVLVSKENKSNGNTVSRYDYVVNKLGQRVSVQHSGSAFAVNAFNLYGYDSKGQVTTAQRYTGGTLDSPEDPRNDQQFGFIFDNTGNRVTSTHGFTSGTYGINTLNQYTAIQTGTNAVVNPAYDNDGNQTSDGTLINQWDGENRLVSITKPDGTVITFAYDAQSRRVRKTVTNGTSITSDIAFLYDEWNMVAEYDLTNIYGPTLTAANIWGGDLSGDLRNAGGVGGLLARTIAGETYAYTYDGNGNVSELLDTISFAAHYEYGPFGEPVSVSGVMAESNPSRFSTKYTDDESGLVYYGYRYYNTSTGRWINRDPMEEEGSIGLYLFVRNSALAGFDPDGRFELSDLLNTGSYGLTIPIGNLAVSFSLSASNIYLPKWEVEWELAFSYGLPTGFLGRYISLPLNAEIGAKGSGRVRMNCKEIADVNPIGKIAVYIQGSAGSGGSRYNRSRYLPMESKTMRSTRNGLHMDQTKLAELKDGAYITVRGQSEWTFDFARLQFKSWDGIYIDIEGGVRFGAFSYTTPTIHTGPWKF